MLFTWQAVVTAIVGSFATAFVCKDTGRDPRLGGIVGMLTGFFFGIFGLASLWAYLYLNRLNARLVKRPTRWYLWWR
jgi:hypothetical protein